MEGERLAAVVGCVKLRAVSLKGAAVVYIDLVACEIVSLFLVSNCDNRDSPALVLREHSTALSTWMSSGFSSAETELRNSAAAAVKDEKRMMLDVLAVCVVSKYLQ